MEEIKGILTTSTIFNGTCNEYEGVRIKKELGVVVAIDNENEFKGVFTKYGEVDIFKQLLFPIEPLIPYKDCGDIIFDFTEVTYGKMYGGYVYVVHYNFASTAS